MTAKKKPAKKIARSPFQEFFDSESAGGIVLIGAALLALACANSPFAGSYFTALQTYIGPLSVLHWINDALMAFFFLLVGLEIKREMLLGHLASWKQRMLPGAAAAGGMIAPALIYLIVNRAHPAAWPGWAIPTATDIAFALGVLSLLGKRVPLSLKVFLAALAIFDDLGAVVIIALFYAGGLAWPYLLGSTAVMGALAVMNRQKKKSLPIYLLLGAVLWLLVFKSGVHATIAGVLLALMIPIAKMESASLLHKLEHALHKPVAFFVIPVFGFANAGVSFYGMADDVLRDTLTTGVAAALVFGKVIGVMGASWLMVRFARAKLPEGANWRQMFGVSLLCGIGFTMSLFIALLAFTDPALQDRVKFGVLTGSAIAGVVGYLVLRLPKKR